MAIYMSKKFIQGAYSFLSRRDLFLYQNWGWFI